MTNYDIIKIVNLAINKDINGNAFSPDEYKTMINTHSMRLFMDRLGLTQEYNGQPISRQGVSISKVNESSLLPFLVVTTFTPSGGTITFPSTCAFVQTLIPTVLKGRGFDEVYPYELGDRLGDPIVAPTESDPISVWLSPTQVQIYPSTINSVRVFYYKYPTEANFSITPDSLTLLPVYTSITELEWDDRDKTEIAYRMIREAGVNIERGDVVGYSNQVIQTGK